MKTAHKMSDLIQLIRDIFSLDDKSGNKDIRIAEYLDKMKSNFGNVMDGHSNLSPPVLPSIFFQSQANKKIQKIWCFVSLLQNKSAGFIGT